MHIRLFGICLLTLAVLDIVGGQIAHAETCQLKRVASLPMTIGPANEILVPGVFNDKKTGPILIDTGAYVSLLRDSVADELGLSRFQLRKGVYGAGGGFLDQGVSVKLQFDKLISPDAAFVLAPDRSFSNSEIIGVFGEDYLNNYDIELDFKGKKVNLFSQDHCPGQVVYWAKSFVEIPFLLNQSNQIEMLINLEGTRLRAILDTGASASLVGLSVAHGEFGLSPESPGMEQVGAVTTADGAKLAAYRYRFHKLEIGGIAFGNPQLVLIPTLKIDRLPPGSRIKVAQGEQPQMTLGMNELTKLHIYIAYGERTLYATPISAEP
jgi:predicted aspartyl protease